MQLNIAEDDFEEMWPWTVNTDSHPIEELNAQAYNVIDGIVYGMFSPTYPTPSTGYLCRFSHVQNSAVCLCEVNTAGSPTNTVWGNAGTITKDGTYYLGREGGTYLLKLESVHSIPSPPPSTPVSSLGNCNMVQLRQGRGAYVPITNWGLTKSDLDVLYGIDPTCSSCTRSYEGVWEGGGSPFTGWRPGGQNYADYIDFEYNGITYLIGLGASDGSVAIIKLDGVGGGDFAGYAYSRVTVDYTGSSSTVRTMSGFGAG